MTQSIDPVSSPDAYRQSLLAAHSADPSRLAALQTVYLQQQMALWGAMLARESGQPAGPVPALDNGDKRFAGEAWNVSEDRISFRDDRVFIGNESIPFGELTKNANRLAFCMAWEVLWGTGVAVTLIVLLSSLMSVRRVLVLPPAIVFQS